MLNFHIVNNVIVSTNMLSKVSLKRRKIGSNFTFLNKNVHITYKTKKTTIQLSLNYFILNNMMIIPKDIVKSKEHTEIINAALKSVY